MKTIGTENKLICIKDNNSVESIVSHYGVEKSESKIIIKRSHNGAGKVKLVSVEQISGNIVSLDEVRKCLNDANDFIDKKIYKR